MQVKGTWHHIAWHEAGWLQGLRTYDHAVFSTLLPSENHYRIRYKPQYPEVLMCALDMVLNMVQVELNVDWSQHASLSTRPINVPAHHSNNTLLVCLQRPGLNECNSSGHLLAVLASLIPTCTCPFRCMQIAVMYLQFAIVMVTSWKENRRESEYEANREMEMDTRLLLYEIIALLCFCILYI